MRIGLGYRQHLDAWLRRGPASVGCLEITADHFFPEAGGLDPAELPVLGERYPLMVHGLSLSLGTPGPLDSAALEAFAAVAEAADPLWVSEHVAFTRSGRIDLGHLNPVPMTEESLGVLTEHTREVQRRCGRPMLLENITTHLGPIGEMDEPVFLNRLCESSGCGLLLDVTNVLINARNRGADPHGWLEQLDLNHVRQLHAVGYGWRDGRWQDTHAAPLDEEVLELVRWVTERAPVEVVTLERDDPESTPEELEHELRRLERAIGG